VSLGGGHLDPVQGTSWRSGTVLPARRLAPGTLPGMAKIHSSTLPNGLPLYRVDLPGTRAVTVLVAFEAGARTERPEENGMAHFLEHLVFKGGVKYDDYRKVNETAERMGAVLNAYTSHDLVAFHITSRAEVVGEAIDLLTDFVGRPKVDQEELDRERGVVIQEIARANDQPSVVAEHLIDRAAFGDHPLGRPVLGPEEHLRTFSRDAILAFRRRQWAGSRGGAFLVGNLEHVPDNQELVETFGRFPSIQPDGGWERAPELQPRTLVEARDSNQSHLRISYRPSIDARDQEQRAALAVYGTLLGGSMGSRLFDEIREQRGLAYSVYSVDHAFADVPILQLSAGLESSKCREAYTRMREIVDDLRDNGPTEEEVERARAYAAGRRVLAFENTNAVARHAATQTVVHNQEIDPDAAIAVLDRVTYEQVMDVARGISEGASVACVGPHDESEFA
jgi:predicted Zn-dependent peptidase